MSLTGIHTWPTVLSSKIKPHFSPQFLYIFLTYCGGTFAANWIVIQKVSLAGHIAQVNGRDFGHCIIPPRSPYINFTCTPFLSRKQENQRWHPLRSQSLGPITWLVDWTLLVLIVTDRANLSAGCRGARSHKGVQIANDPSKTLLPAWARWPSLQKGKWCFLVQPTSLWVFQNNINKK